MPHTSFFLQIVLPPKVDIFGVLLLVVMAVAFGFLTRSFLKVKNRWLKWVGSIFSSLLTLISTSLLVLALIGYYKLNQRYPNPVSELQVVGTPDQVARGEKLAHICVSCHSENNQLPLTGSNFAVKFDFPPFGTLYAPNLTPSGNIKDWTDQEMIRAIREGVDRNGRSLLIMPSANFRNLSDEDVEALVAYLRSQPAAGEPLPDSQFNIVGAIFANMFDFRTAQQPVGHISAPQPGTPAYGKYLVDTIGCRDCHGDELQGKVENGQPGPPPGPNLTQIIPNWTEEEFMTFFNTGVLPGGGQVPMITLKSGFSEPRMPWPVVRAVTSDDDLRAMYAYLHNLTPVKSSSR